jgi:hypothetical protein
MLTRQEIFDKAVGGVIAHGGPSVKRLAFGVECLYRGPDGRRCAAGQLVPDHLYDPRAEGGRISAQAHLIDTLQYAHDDVASTTKNDADFLVRFREKVRDIATRHSLNAAVAAPPDGAAS